MKFGVVRFPGSNCDFDAYHVLRNVMKRPTVMLWHKDHDLQGVDCVVLPGGFAYGDYLRAGAIARFSPLMQEVETFAGGGGRVLGICNGFQVLLELGLLPGAMLRNDAPQVPLPARPHPRRGRPDRLHPRGQEGPGPAHAHRPRRRQLLRPPPSRSGTSSGTGRSSSATATPAAGSPRRPTSTAPWPASPASEPAGQRPRAHAPPGALLGGPLGSEDGRAIFEIPGPQPRAAEAGRPAGRREEGTP